MIKKKIVKLANTCICGAAWGFGYAVAALLVAHSYIKEIGMGFTFNKK